MKFFPSLLCAAFSLSLATAARSQDGNDSLRQAVETLKTVPAFRMRMTSTDLESKQSNNAVLEKVNPDTLHVRLEEDGHVKMELVTDGKATWYRQGEAAKFEEASSAMATIVNSVREKMTPEAMLKNATNVKVAGHETINGTAMTIVSLETEQMGTHTAAKMWIADKDHRPVKTEGDTMGEIKIGGRPGRKVNRHSTTTYDYDPSIKVNVPPAN